MPGRCWATCEQIVAIELLCAAQALDLRLAGTRRRTRRARAPGSPSAAPGPRAGSPPLGEDREPGPDLATLAAIVREGRWPTSR